MKYSLVISSEARLDIFEAFLWYEEQREGLGHDFELCLEAGLNKLLRHPQIFQIRYGVVRVHFIERFPYGIHFIEEENVIRVFGIYHTSKDPLDWSRRLD